jgi:hypothetical protein
MHFDSFSLGVARHLFQKLVLFFLCEVIVAIHCCFHLNFLFDTLTLKPLGLYVNLVRHLVAYPQPFNLVHR